MNILKTLQFMKNDIKAVVWDNDIDQIKYDDSEDFRPTKEEILAINQDDVNCWYNKKNYATLRAKEYPPITDYLDAIVKGDDVQRQKYINDCLNVKAKYPKE